MLRVVQTLRLPQGVFRTMSSMVAQSAYLLALIARGARPSGVTRRSKASISRSTRRRSPSTSGWLLLFLSWAQRPSRAAAAATSGPSRSSASASQNRSAGEAWDGGGGTRVSRPPGLGRAGPRGSRTVSSVIAIQPFSFRTDAAIRVPAFRSPRAGGFGAIGAREIGAEDPQRVVLEAGDHVVEDPPVLVPAPGLPGAGPVPAGLPDRPLDRGRRQAVADAAQRL